MINSNDANNSNSSIVFSLNASALFQIFQFTILFLSGYALLRCIHVLQKPGRRVKQAKQAKHKYLPSNDESRTTLDESYLTTTETIHNYAPKRKSPVSHKPHKQQQDKALRSKNKSRRSVVYYVQAPRERRYENTTDIVTNQSSADLETQYAISAISTQAKNTNTSIVENSKLTESNKLTSTADCNVNEDKEIGKDEEEEEEEEEEDNDDDCNKDVQQENEEPDEVCCDFDKRKTSLNKSNDGHRNQSELQSRIKFTTKSADSSCHRRFLAGTQEKGTPHAFPASSDRLDCATQFVSRVPSSVIVLGPSAPKRYLSSITVSAEAQVLDHLAQRSTSRRKRSNQTSPTIRYLHDRKRNKTPEQKVIRKTKVYSTSHQSKNTNRKTYKLGRSLKTRSKNTTESNFNNTECPDVNTNYAAVSLEECGKELNRLIQDTLREYGDWNIPRHDRASCVRNGEKAGWSGTVRHLNGSNNSPKMYGRSQNDSLSAYPLHLLPNYENFDNANCNKLLQRESLFHYSPKPAIRKTAQNQSDHVKPVVLANLLRELEMLTRKINQHYDNNETLMNKKRNDQLITNVDKISPTTVTECSQVDDCEDRQLVATLSGVSDNDNQFYGRTHSVHSLCSRSPQIKSPQSQAGRSLIKSTISQRKKVFIETCPIPLTGAEMVSYLELVPKYNPIGGFQFSQLATVPSYPEPSPPRYRNTRDYDSAESQTFEHMPSVTYTKEDDLAKFTGNRYSEIMSKSITVQDISMQTWHEDRKYISGETRSLSGITQTLCAPVSNQGDNNKQVKQKEVKPAKVGNMAPTSSPNKPRDLPTPKKRQLINKGSYVANFRKTLKRKQKALGSSPPRRRNKTLKKLLADPSPEKLVKGPQKVTISSQIAIGKSPELQNNSFYQTESCAQTRSILSPPKKKVTYDQSQNILQGWGGKKIPNRWNDQTESPKGAQQKYRILDAPVCRSKTLLNSHPYKSSMRSPTGRISAPRNKWNFRDSILRRRNKGRDVEQHFTGTSHTNKETLSGKLFSFPTPQSTVPIYSKANTDCPHSASPPNGPIESVRYEMKSDFDFGNGYTQRIRKDFDKSPWRQNVVTNIKRIRTAFLGDTVGHRKKLGYPYRIRRKFSFIGQNGENLESDSGIEKKEITTNSDEDKTRTISPHSPFYSEQNYCRLGEIHENSKNLKGKSKRHFWDKKSRIPVCIPGYFSPKCTDVSGQSNLTHFSGNFLNRKFARRKNMCGSHKPKNKKVMFPQRKFHEDDMISVTHSKSKQKSLLSSRTCDFENSDPDDTGYTAINPTSAEQSTGSSDLENQGRCATFHDLTSFPKLKGFVKLSHSSPDLTGTTFNDKGSRLTGNDILTGITSATTEGNQTRRQVKWLKNNFPFERNASVSEGYNYGRDDTRIRNLNIKRNRTLKGRRYEICTRGQGSGVERYRRYCMSTSSTEGHGSSSSTDFLLDTLDEISESLSDDNIMYW